MNRKISGSFHMEAYFGHVWLVRLLVQRGLAAVYLTGFIVARNQFKPLLGGGGFLPVPDFLRRAGFWDAPSIFHWRYSDRVLEAVAWTGIILSSAAVIGLSEAVPIWVSAILWLALWVLYLSIVNAGQTFYAFGWESMLMN